jgi:hypothetical protein
MAFATSYALLRRDIRGWAALFRFYKTTKRFPSNSHALPFIFWASIHRPWRASRRTARRPDRAVRLFASSCAWGFCNSPMKHFALLGG